MKTYSLIATLQDEQGRILKNRFVESDVSGAVINAEGVLTLDTSKKNKILKLKAVDGKPSLTCTLPVTEKLEDKSVRFINALKCSAEHVENK